MPGAGKQPPEIQQQIKTLLEAGFDPTTIHRRLKVGRSSIYRMKRCLQRHGTAYMPPELNKKNGRPKVLTADQELQVRDWLRKPENRTRYLDDLVWLIHDRFGIVCSTTTMSKLKRKWLRVIEYEETGRPIDAATRVSLLETHPDLPILADERAVMPAGGEDGEYEDGVEGMVGGNGGVVQQRQPQQQQRQRYATPPAAVMMMTPPTSLPQPLSQPQPQARVAPVTPVQPIRGHRPMQPYEPRVDSQLQQQIQREIASAGPSRS